MATYELWWESAVFPGTYRHAQVNDLTCASAAQGIRNVGDSLGLSMPDIGYMCESDPVAPGGKVYFNLQGSIKTVLFDSISNTTTVPATPISANWQSAIQAQNAQIAALQVQVAQTLLNGAAAGSGASAGTSNVIDPDIVTAMGAVFGAFLAAGVVLWGMRRLAGLFSSTGAHE